MDLSKFFKPDQEAWDEDEGRLVKQGIYKFPNTKAFNDAVKEVIGLQVGENYAFIYQRDQGSPTINLIVADPDTHGLIKHKSWQCYVSSVTERRFSKMLSFLKPINN